MQSGVRASDGERRKQQGCRRGGRGGFLVVRRLLAGGVSDKNKKCGGVGRYAKRLTGIMTWTITCIFSGMSAMWR